MDPSLLFADGKTYFVSPDNKGSFLLGELDVETGEFVSEPVKIAEGLGGSSPEGPHLYKIADYYYLMSAEGGTGYEHREVIQRSKSPYGPYEPSPRNPVASNMSDPNNPIQAIGHADMFQTPDGEWWLVCLGIRPIAGMYHHLGRETSLALATWDENGWPKVGSNGIAQREYASPKLPRHGWDREPARDAFDAPELRLSWNFIRNPHDRDWSLAERPGFLRLNGSAVSFAEKDSPAFVGRRQTAFDLTASTQLEFASMAENEEAGLVARANDKNHYDLVIAKVDGQRVVKLRKTLQGAVTETFLKAIPQGAIVLGISATEREYRFWARSPGSAAAFLGSAPTKDLSTEVVSGFAGVFIGMYASGNGEANANPADFDWFDFEEDALRK